MSYRDVLLPMIDGALHDAVVQVASTLAAVAGGRVTTLAIASFASPVPTAWSYCPPGSFATVEQAALATVHAQSSHAAERFAREPVDHEGACARSFWLTPGEAAQQRTIYADIIVVGMSRPPTIDQLRVAGLLLAGAGRPVVLVPENASVGDRFQRISVAWCASRDATRAVHDALPLLQGASEVELVTAGDEDTEGEARHLLTEFRAHLRRHGVETTAACVPREGDDVGIALMRHFDHRAPDLVIAGGYTHTRARHLGRVSRYLVERLRCPLLLAH